MKLSGISITNGVAIGRVMRYVSDEAALEESSYHASDKVEYELARYHSAKRQVRGELEQLERRAVIEGQDHRGIFNAHTAMLEDEILIEEIETAIAGGKLCASKAVTLVFERYEAILRQTGETLIQERAVDLDDIKLRLLRALSGCVHHDLSRLPGPVIVVTEDLLPSDAATLDQKNVLAIVTQAGSKTSHSAIIARSYGIPAVLGVPNALEEIQDGEMVVVDAGSGVVLTQLNQEEMEYYQLLRKNYLLDREKELGAGQRLPITKDGVRIAVGLNMETLTNEIISARNYVDGVGLFRTEFLFLDRWSLPDEEEQFQTYRRVVEAFEGKPVTLRTLDLGGDKQADCLTLPREPNPFLGNRALRLCLARPEMFRVQLRAALRASVCGNLRLMLPMVSSMEDIHEAKIILEQAKDELRRKGQPFDEKIQIGIMVEIPAIAMVADMAAQEVDFASIGSNDLCQYMMAADRENPAVAPYYRTFHPAMLRLIGGVVEAFHRQGKRVSVCGEMGGDPVGVLALLGLGVDTLSMGVASVPVIKRVISSVSQASATKLVERVKKYSMAEDIQTALQEFLDSLHGM